MSYFTKALLGTHKGSHKQDKGICSRCGAVGPVTEPPIDDDCDRERADKVCRKCFLSLL